MRFISYPHNSASVKIPDKLGKMRSIRLPYFAEFFIFLTIIFIELRFIFKSLTIPIGIWTK